MIQHIYQFCLFVLVLIPTLGVCDQETTINGIWQDNKKPNNYYSIHQDTNIIVLIDLARLESSGETFSATYIGSVTDKILKPLSPINNVPLSGLSIQLKLHSNTLATIIPICDICSVVTIDIKKVF